VYGEDGIHVISEARFVLVESVEKDMGDRLRRGRPSHGSDFWDSEGI